MKFILTSLILSFLLSIIQCGKPTNPQIIENNQLIGQWQWISSIGGIGGWTRTPATEGHEIILAFESDSTFLRTTIDTTGGIIISYILSGSYHITYEQIWNVNDSGDVIYMSGLLRSVFELANDTLFLTEICYDCFGHTYVRIK